eukprot:symbB.v1.2.005515.t1/scaffold310.1/size231343/20
MGWTEWPLDFSESSSWPAFWRMAPVHLEKMLERGDLGFSVEADWGYEEEVLPNPSIEEVEAALMNWMEVSTSLSKPEQFPHERLAEDLAHVKQLRLLVAGLL